MQYKYRRFVMALFKNNFYAHGMALIELQLYILLIRFALVMTCDWDALVAQQRT